MSNSPLILSLMLKDLESKEKEPVEWSKELEKKRGVKAQAADILSVDHSSRAHLRFCENSDGKNLQMFLNEHWKDHGSIVTEVVMSLQRSADPAKLVLEAMEGFYPLHLCKGDREFEGKVARRSCILLLEHLMELSPKIEPHIREKAMILSFDWETKMKVESGHELEVLGFLWLLASFRLAHTFDANKLLDALVFVARHIHNTEIFKALGLEDKIHCKFLKKLARSEQHMQIIRYIYALGLAEEESHKHPREFIAAERAPKRLKGSKQGADDDDEVGS
ncbi:truncated FRIGIDA-like protein 1 [Hibiscus syriacus]|uniref:truncated FRIGIDA-like protein 1 n=1 Tax=Hibiscus syriacus TaxID=106335 RepID=UPI001921B298|nr:truncated FRIGIDA-like protein 1 [Hibiscus syriacus]